jgi:hypothetical protein
MSQTIGAPRASEGDRGTVGQERAQEESGAYGRERTSLVVTTATGGVGIGRNPRAPGASCAGKRRGAVRVIGLAADGASKLARTRGPARDADTCAPAAASVEPNRADTSGSTSIMSCPGMSRRSEQLPGRADGTFTTAGTLTSTPLQVGAAAGPALSTSIIARRLGRRLVTANDGHRVRSDRRRFRRPRAGTPPSTLRQQRQDERLKNDIAIFSGTSVFNFGLHGKVGAWLAGATKVRGTVCRGAQVRKDGGPAVTRADRVAVLVSRKAALYCPRIAAPEGEG